MTDPDEVVLISSTTWLRERGEGGYHEIDSRRVLGLLESLDCHRLMAARHFAAELGRFDVQRMNDQEVLKLIRDAIRDGRALVVQKGGATANQPSANAELRRLVAQVEKATRGKLTYQGRQYKLVPDIELAGLPGRDYYEVASQSEARAVLSGIAQESPPSAELLRKASEKLSKDWRAPFQADGLVLLRRIPVQAAAPKDQGPALTPSQMKALLQKDWIEIEVVDQDGEPYPAHYRLELASRDIRQGDLDENGCLSVSETESGTCKLTVGEVRLAATAGEPTPEPTAKVADEAAEAAPDTGQDAQVPDDGGPASEADIFDEASDGLEAEPLDRNDEDGGTPDEIS